MDNGATYSGQFLQHIWVGPVVTLKWYSHFTIIVTAGDVFLDLHRSTPICNHMKYEWKNNDFDDPIKNLEVLTFIHAALLLYKVILCIGFPILPSNKIPKNNKW